jgi:hypothetical protein
MAGLPAGWQRGEEEGAGKGSGGSGVRGMDETTVGSQYLDWRRWGPANSDISLNLTQLNRRLVELSMS